MEKLRILVAENDEKNLEKIQDAIDSNLFDIVEARDGVQALQIALQGELAIIFISLDLPLIDGVKLSQIIRTNPKTESIPIFYIHDKTVHLTHFRRNTDYFVIKPFNVDELRKMLNNTRKKLLDANYLKQKEEFAGNLKQMQMSDLLQVLSMNQKTGNLYIFTGSDDKEKKAVVSIDEGRVINASINKVSGLKALYRMLCLKEGYFSFLPGEPELPVLINEATDTLLMEGLRQNDEMAELRKRLGGDNLRVFLNIKLENLPKGLRTKTVEVISAIEVFPDLNELIDNVDISDYEILKIVAGLKEKGVVKIEETDKYAPADNVYFSSDLMLELKKSITKKFSGSLPPHNILLPIFFSESDTEVLLKAFLNFNFLPDKDDTIMLRQKAKQIGYLGILRLVESINIILVYILNRTVAKPLCSCFFNGAVGGIVVGDRDKFNELNNMFRKKVVFVSPKETLNFETLKKAILKVFENFIKDVQ